MEAEEKSLSRWGFVAMHMAQGAFFTYALLIAIEIIRPGAAVAFVRPAWLLWFSIASAALVLLATILPKPHNEI